MLAFLRRRSLDLVYAIAAILTAPFWMRKARGGWRERFGHHQPTTDPPDQRAGHLMVHAVSVGEVNLTVPLIRRLVGEGAGRVTLSVTTDTGIARARSLFADDPRVAVVRYPLDASWAVRRFLDHVRPDAILLVELEIWPNMLDECRRRGIPVAVVNGRLSERSFRGYRKLRPILKRYFRQLAFAAVQDDSYAHRFRAMGVPADRVHTVGSIKWDSADMGVPADQAEKLAEELRIDPDRPLIVAGSTAPAEHRLLVEATQGLDCQLLCAPRRPEWFDEAARALGEHTVRRSNPDGGDPEAGRFLLDSIGELRAAYALADIVVIGRSFVDLAGSDPMEAAALGRPVLIGPAHGDFIEPVTVLKEAGGLLVVEPADLRSVIVRLLSDPSEREKIAEAAAACVAENAGATERHAGLIQRYLQSRTATIDA